MEENKDVLDLKKLVDSNGRIQGHSFQDKNWIRSNLEGIKFFSCSFYCSNSNHQVLHSWIQLPKIDRFR